MLLNESSVGLTVIQLVLQLITTCGVCEWYEIVWVSFEIN